MNELNEDVHTEHCCKWHGCKYGNDDCTVENEILKQSFPCELCQFNYKEFLECMELKGSDWVKFMEDNSQKFTDSEQEVKWIQVNQIKPYQAVKLTRDNCQPVAEWMLCHGGFDFVKCTEYGITTNYGKVSWGEWIVREDYSAVSFYSDNEFNVNYFIR